MLFVHCQRHQADAFGLFAADRLAEERIRKVAEVKKYGGELPPMF